MKSNGYNIVFIKNENGYYVDFVNQENDDIMQQQQRIVYCSFAEEENEK